MASQEVSEYVLNYQALYKVVSLVSERLNLKLVICTLYEGIEKINIDSISKALKNSYPSIKELFKKLPLRCLHYINPQSSATMKSLTKHLEEQKLSVVQNDGVWSINTCSTEESITASTMRLMVLFQKFIESARTQILIDSVEDRLKQQISVNKEMSEKISALTKSLSKIITGDYTPKEKLSKILTVLEGIEEKAGMIDMLLEILSEWIEEGPKTHSELCNEIHTTNDLLGSMNEVLELLRMIPFDKAQAKDLETVQRLFRLLNDFVDKKIVFPKDLDIKICRLANTLSCSMSKEMGQKFRSSIPEFKKTMVELRRCYEIEMTPEVRVKKIPGIECKIPVLADVIQKIAIDREEVTFEYFLSLLGDFPDMRKQIYRNLERHNIEWSDDYFKGLYNDFAALFKLSK